MSNAMELPELNADCLHQLFERLGPASVCACARVCAEWRAVARSPLIWQALMTRQFGVRLALSDPRAAYEECHAAWREWREPSLFHGERLTLADLVIPSGGAVGASPGLPPLLSPRAYACSDARGEFRAYYPPAVALRGYGPLDSCWCTSTGVNTDVGVLMDLGGWVLVRAVGAVNPSDGFDNQVRELLAFPSDVPSVAELPALLSSAAGTPIVRLCFPEFPACRGRQLVRATAPVLCRYLRLLLRSSFNPRGHPADVQNIDVSKLQVFGTPLGERFASFVRPAPPPSERAALRPVVQSTDGSAAAAMLALAAATLAAADDGDADDDE